MIQTLRACAFAILIAFVPGSLVGQVAPSHAPLEEFVQRIATLWSSAKVADLVDTIREDNRFLLDLGSGVETATPRHAAAALRALFASSETVDAHPARTTITSAEPPTGFGEISWKYRTRGAPGEEIRSIYVGARWDSGARPGWRLTELRVIP